MRFSTLVSLAAAIMSVPLALADDKLVVAHFIAGNAAGMSASDWAGDIDLATAAHIDGFAMNIAAGDPNTDTVLQTAYQAAEAAGNFSLFLSFDYLSEGAWDAGTAINLINQYKDSSAQLLYQGKPLVSTFEGVDNIQDWSSIKAATGCFFMPDYSSLGAAGVAANFDVVDGALSWDAWPNGPTSLDTSGDEGYMSALAGRPYMMPISPWFYTNIPEWDKNWVWRGDSLWTDRWEQATELQPALIEILTWNDYGESHYIGPIHESGIPTGADYVTGYAHDGWRAQLPTLIDAYKSNNATSTPASESITYWYKLAPSTAGTVAGTTGNDPAEGQTPYSPLQISTDTIHTSVLVAEPSDVSIQVGENTPTALRASTAGINYLSVSMNGQTGNVTVTVSRNGQQIVTTTGPEITDSPPNGIVNFNAYVGSSDDGTPTS